MLPVNAARLVKLWQDGLQVLGKTVTYQEAGGTARNVRARVVYQSAAELANSIELYPIRVHVDARDFATRAPLKGDTVTIDGARRGVMQVGLVHVADVLVAYRLGVAG